jgi:hypothetical protein
MELAISKLKEMVSKSPSKRSISMERLNDKDLKMIELMNKHPHIREQITSLLLIADADDRGLVKADDAEMRIVEAVRNLGHDVLQGWAASQEQLLEKQYKNDQSVKKHGKKKSIGTQHLE